MRYMIAFTVIVSILEGQPAHHDPVNRDRIAGRASTVRQLQQDVVARVSTDAQRITPAYAEARLAKIRQLVRDQVLEVLNQGGSAADVRTALTSLFGPAKATEDYHPFVYVAAREGFKGLIVGYSWRYGFTGVPESKVVIDGYRYAGTGYEFAATVSRAFEVPQTGNAGCELRLEEWPSPRSKEAWFFARCHIYGASRFLQMIGLYGFDGYEFKELWAPKQPRKDLEYRIDGSIVTMTYGDEEREAATGRDDVFQDTIELVSGGPVITTVVLPEK